MKANCSGCGAHFGCGCQLTNGLCAACIAQLQQNNNHVSS